MTTSDRPPRLVTSLGPVLERRGAFWVLDLTDLPIFHGLSVLSRGLGDSVIEQTRSDRVDVTVEHVVHPRENPELRRTLGVALVKICAEYETVAAIAQHPALFQDRLRALFGTLQRRVYRDALFPPDGAGPSRALVFDFRADAREPEAPYHFILERLVSARHQGECWLRITMESPEGRRLALGSIPHVQVRAEDLKNRTFIAGSTRIAQTWGEELRREAARGRRAHVEHKKPYSHLFTQLAKAGLGAVEQVTLTWTDDLAQRILEANPADLDALLKRVLLALEDVEVRRILEARGVIEVVCDDVAIYLDRSHLGRGLNLSLGQPRLPVGVETFLERMPALQALASRHANQPLRGIKVFLIHHMTAEVIGFVAALRRLGCRDLVTLFVAYAGEAPGPYLGALLDLPPDECRFLALVNVPEGDSVEGHYRLSTQYSRLDDHDTVSDVLSRRRPRFYEAMQGVGLVELMRQIQRAEQDGSRTLIIEDGGYLAPLVNDALLRRTTVRDLLGQWDPLSADERPVRDVLREIMVGSVEHTRSGHDRLAEVEGRHGLLALPAFSIAVSHLKRVVEAREVATSVLNAIENVLHATGRVLARRHCLVFGSRGAIGRQIVTQLQRRLEHASDQLFGVDLQPAVLGHAGSCFETVAYRDLPENTRRTIDLIIGVTGRSVLEPCDLEDWLLHASPDELVLASGSTKTDEFAGLARWLDELLADPEPRIGGRRGGVAMEDVLDPVTGRLFGRRCRFTIHGPSDGVSSGHVISNPELSGDAMLVEEGPATRNRNVLFLAQMTPVNFLFYGVPSEIIDEVLAQLLRCALGLTRRHDAAPALAPRLYAVDRDIDADGCPLHDAWEARRA